MLAAATPVGVPRSRCILRLRTPIVGKNGRRLRVCSVARYSTDEQRRQSILAQHRYNRSALESAGIFDFDWFEISDEGVSGELVDRPGIARLREGILNGEWDLIICEDSSRLYRNLVACMQLAYTIVDAGIRLICIGDDVDSAEEDWSERLEEAQKHHCRDNKYTRRRLKRSIEDLWEDGSAVGPLRPGFRRVATIPGKDGVPPEGPFKDELMVEWKPVIYEAYERVTRCEPLWAVAIWLTKMGLPRLGNRPGPWTERKVRTLIRCEVYRGVEYYGKLKSVKKFVSGKTRQEQRAPEEIKTREVPHCRVVSDLLWYQANAAITSPDRPNRPRNGGPHPLAGIPRDSRGPLSKIFVCGVCDEKMYAEGRNAGGYRCKHAKRGLCWNHATVLKNLVHRNISKAIARELLPDPPLLQAFVEYATGMVANGDNFQSEEDRLLEVERSLKAKCAKLAAAIETKDTPPETLIERLAQRENELTFATAELAAWRQRQVDRPAVPTVESISAIVKATACLLLEMDKEVGVLLEQLIVGKIRAVPYRQLGTSKVVLRAEFELSLVKLLPNNLIALLSGDFTGDLHSLLPPKRVCVELFEPTAVVINASLAHELAPFLTLVEIGLLLGISKRQALRATQLGKAMHDQGLTDPFIRLDEAPKNASRWRPNPRSVDGEAGADPKAA